MTAVSVSSHGVRMLSPPYSPHLLMHQSNDVAKEEGNVHNSQIEAEKTVDAKIRSGNMSSGSTSSSAISGSSDEEDLTENDDLDDLDGNSGPAHSDDKSANASSRKRAASEVLIGDDYMYSGIPSGSFKGVTSQDDSHTSRERRMTTCWDRLLSNPAKYWRQERSFLDLYPLRRHSWAGPGSTEFGASDEGSSSESGVSRPSTSSSSDTGATRTHGRGRRPQRLNSGTNGSGNSCGWRGRRRATAETSSQSSRDSETDNSSRSSSGSTSVQVGHASTRVHDISYNQLEDYSPSVQQLPPGKSLRAEWKGAPMDLSGDPDLPLLHPAEAHLASILRLPCDVYLDSKRRLFAEKVHRLRQGLPFRRTDSQKACRIDVNKASRLFGAFERIGWLDDSHFMKHLK